MASAQIAYRRSAVGISAGLGIALPLAAYAATLPFDGVNEVIRSNAMPFSVGILAGAGALALTSNLLDRHARRVEAEQAEAAQFASIFSDTDAVAPRTARTSDAAPRGTRFAGANAPKGVPVISRAIDALDEAEAWAEIDAMFNDDSPISCDPARSKDMYQIALEELRRTEQAATRTATGAPAAQAPATAGGYSPAAAAANTSNAYASATFSASNPVAPFASSTIAAAPTPEEQQEVSDRLAAMQALYGTSVTTPAAPATPVITTPAAPAAPVAIISDDDYDVPVADYSGHEGMWAQALAILQEGIETAPGTRGEVSASMPPMTSKHAAARPSETSFVSPERMAAVAEGGNATMLHSRVNSLIEEEFDKVPSKSVRRTSHEYLKVIEGGTASMPRMMQAEA